MRLGDLPFTWTTPSSSHPFCSWPCAHEQVSLTNPTGNKPNDDNNKINCLGGLLIDSKGLMEAPRKILRESENLWLGEERAASLLLRAGEPLDQLSSSWVCTYRNQFALQIVIKGPFWKREVSS